MGPQSNIAKGLAAGIAGGLVASVLMNQFQALVGKLMADESRSHGAQRVLETRNQRAGVSH